MFRIYSSRIYFVSFRISYLLHHQRGSHQRDLFSDDFIFGVDALLTDAQLDPSYLSSHPSGLYIRAFTLY